MSKQRSSRPATTQGKRARIAVGKLPSYPAHLKYQDTLRDGASDELKRNTDSKGVGSDQKEKQSPPRKRQRSTATKSTKTPARKQQVKSKSSRVVGLADMPIGILTKIASNLEPIDVIFLARLNKHFRNLLITRSSIGIWRRLIDNTFGLPGCPPGMSEPRYLALVFLDTCTSCGEDGKTEIDEVLRVRLCASCRDTCLIVRNTVPDDVMTVIPFSAKIALNPRRSHSYSLQADVSGLVAESEEIKKLNKWEAHQAWTAEKRDILQGRLLHARSLQGYFELMELVRKQDMEYTKVGRQEEIKQRLEEAGWTSEEMDFDYAGCSNKHAWLDLVSQPKPLTEQEWLSLKSNLITVLEDNRKQRLEVGRQARKKERQARLEELLRAIEEKDSFSIEIPAPVPGSSNPDLASPISVFYSPPFPPNLSQMLNYPIVLDLYETDRSVTEMEAKFEANRKEIEKHTAEWADRVHAHLTKLALQGPKITKNALLSTSIAREKKPNPLTKLPDDVKRLVRADSQFKIPFFLAMGDSVTYGSIIRYHHLDGELRFRSTPSPQEPLDLERITWDSEANTVARELLISMGKPNASYLEMTGKKIYICGRCDDNVYRTWQETISHYVYVNQRYTKLQEELSSSKLKITYNNNHDPKVLPKQPLVRYAPTKATDDDSDRFECKLCAKLRASEGFVESEAEVLKHLREVHEITKPKVGGYYGPWVMKSGRYGSGRYDSDDEYFSGGYSGGGYYGGYSDDDYY